MKKIILLILFIASFSLESCVVRQVASKPNLILVKKAPRNHQVVIIKNKKYTRVKIRAKNVATSKPPNKGIVLLNCPQMFDGTVPR